MQVHFIRFTDYNVKITRILPLSYQKITRDTDSGPGQNSDSQQNDIAWSRDAVIFIVLLSPEALIIYHLKASKSNK